MRAGLDHILQISDRARRFSSLLKILEPGDIAIDCGANTGTVAAKFAAAGCIVHCFEPDALAFAKLSAKLQAKENCKLYRAAVWSSSGTAPLYRHEDSQSGDIILTQSSSLISDKKNISVGLADSVELIDFPQFLRELDHKASVLKIDIEGAEGVVLEAILDAHLEDSFSICFVETHESKVPSSKALLMKVRNIIRDRGIKHIFLDWH